MLLLFARCEYLARQGKSYGPCTVALRASQTFVHRGLTGRVIILALILSTSAAVIANMSGDIIERSSFQSKCRDDAEDKRLKTPKASFFHLIIKVWALFCFFTPFLCAETHEALHFVRWSIMHQYGEKSEQLEKGNLKQIRHLPRDKVVMTRTRGWGRKPINVFAWEARVFFAPKMWVHLCVREVQRFAARVE